MSVGRDIKTRYKRLGVVRVVNFNISEYRQRVGLILTPDIFKFRVMKNIQLINQYLFDTAFLLADIGNSVRSMVIPNP